jgi:hypothetical protein
MNFLLEPDMYLRGIVNTLKFFSDRRSAFVSFSERDNRKWLKQT